MSCNFKKLKVYEKTSVYLKQNKIPVLSIWTELCTKYSWTLNCSPGQKPDYFYSKESTTGLYQKDFDSTSWNRSVCPFSVLCAVPISMQFMHQIWM